MTTTFAAWVAAKPEYREKREILAQMICAGGYVMGGWHRAEEAVAILDHLKRPVEDFKEVMTRSYIPLAEECGWSKGLIRRRV
jgi:hypothetical protein